MKKLIRMMAMSLICVFLLGVLSPSLAVAQSPYQIEQQCLAKIVQCNYVVESLGETRLGPRANVSEAVTNLSLGIVTYELSWSQTTSISDELGGSASFQATSGFITAAIRASYSHTWTSSKTESSSISITIPPATTSWVARATVQQQVTGKLIASYPDGTREVHGTFWAPVVTPKPDDPKSGLVVCSSQDPGC